MFFPREAYLIVAAWVLLGAVFAGLGALLRRACRAPATDAAGWLTCFWLGWAAAIFFLQVWQLVFPVDDRAVLVLAAAGLVGLLLAGTGPWRVLGRGVRTSWPALLAFAAVTAWLANRALGGPQNGDTGLYHIPTMRWLVEYPIVPGLGNLYVAYAFNHSYLLYLGLLERGPFVGGSHHLANSLPLLIVFGHVVLGLYRTLRRRAAAEDVFYALGLPAAVALAFDINFTSPAPDFPVFVLGLVLTGHLVRVLVTAPDAPAPAFGLLAVAVLAALGITVKLSTSGLALTTVAVASFAFVRHPRAAAAGRVRTLVVGAFLGSLGVVPWLVRGVLWSGYPLYPSTVAGLPVPWRVPPDLGTWILGVSQIPGPYALAVTDPTWFFTWMQSLGWGERDIVLPLAVAAALLPVGLAVRLRRRGARPVPALVLVPALAQLVFLFVAAPRARYGGATFWLLATESAMLALPAGGHVFAVAGAVALAALPFFDGKPALRQLGGFEPMPRTVVTARELASGLVIQHPGDSQCCWTAPLPCSPDPPPGLRLRHDGDLRSGFVLDPTVSPAPAAPAPPPP